MGGFIPPPATISGTASSPSIPSRDSARTGIFGDSSLLGLTINDLAHLSITQSIARMGTVQDGDGAFVQVAGSPFAGAATTVLTNPVCISPDGVHVMTCDSVLDTVSVFRRDQATGALTQISGSPFSTGAGTDPIAICVSQDGLHVMTANNTGNNVTVFSRNTVSGFLTAVAGSPFSVGGFGTAPQSIAVSPSGAHVAVSKGASDTIAVFSRNAATGFLTLVAGSPFPTGTTPRTIAFSADGLHVGTANSGGNNLSIHSINPVTGALTNVAGSPFATGTTPMLFAFSPDNLHVAVANQGSNNVTMFSRNVASGFLTAVAGSPFAVGALPNGIAFSPDSAHVGVVNQTPKTISVFSRDAATGLLTAVAGSPFATGAAVPRSIIFSPDGLHAITDTDSSTFYVFGTGASIPIVDIDFVNKKLLLLARQVLSMVDNDARYAAIAGNSSQNFAVAVLTAASAAITGAITAASAAITGAITAATVTTTGNITSAGNIVGNGATSAVTAFSASITENINARSVNLTDDLQITGAGHVVTNNGNIMADGVNSLVQTRLGFKVSEAANKKQGVVNLVAGTATVNNTSVTATSRIMLTNQNPSGTVGFLHISARVVGTSFTITSSNALDTSDIAYHIFEKI